MKNSENPSFNGSKCEISSCYQNHVKSKYSSQILSSKSDIMAGTYNEVCPQMGVLPIAPIAPTRR
jgi:hypothetical protein